jgi:hypothetical protein
MKALLLVLVIGLLFLTACSHKDHTTGIPNFADSTWISHYQQVLSFQYQPPEAKSGYLYAYLWVKGPIDSESVPAITVNDQVLDLWETDYNATDGGIEYSFELETDTFNPANSFAYHLTSANHTYNGHITLPSEYQITYPAYVPDTDYVMNWTLQKTPGAQYIYNFIGLPNDETEDTFVQLSNTLRTYTIPKEKLTNAVGFLTFLLSFNVGQNSTTLLTYGETATLNSVSITGYPRKPDMKQFHKFSMRKLMMDMQKDAQ